MASVTASECDLLIALMNTDGIVTVDALLAVLGRDVGAKQLTQRLSALRSKLVKDLKITNPIHNAYGRGYRWAAPPGVQLRHDT